MNTSQIASLVDYLNSLGLDCDIFKNRFFYDEPRFFSFTTRLKITRQFTDGPLGEGRKEGSGTSFELAESAFSKSIFEAMERFCASCYFEKSLISNNNDRRKASFDLSYFSKEDKIDEGKIRGVLGSELIFKAKCLVPAQLVYLNYKKGRGEPSLDYPYNSTGLAGGSSANQAIVNGIYEVVERDSFMNVYLGRISPPRVDLKLQKSRKLDAVIAAFEKYRLEVNVLDLTTDLKIPCFLAVLVDRTGLGPAISLGAKAGFGGVETIIGAISESLMVRIFVKGMLADGSISKDLKGGSSVFANRARLWLLPKTIKDIDFLISGTVSKKRYRSFAGGFGRELSLVVNIFKKLNLPIYCVDLSIAQFRKFNFYTYKAVIPTLQPLYLHEKEKERSLDIERLKRVSAFFGKKYQGINPLPHPFL